MGFGTVFASIAFLFIFASMILVAGTFQRNFTLTAQQQHVRDERLAQHEDMEITIMTSGYSYAALVVHTDDKYAPFAAGSHENTTALGQGSVTLNGTPYSNGTFTGQIIDTGFAGSNYTDIGWTSVEPASTSLAFQVRAENTSAALLAAPFLGPDGTSSTYYTVSGTALHAATSQNRYVQYIANFETNDTMQTPELQALTIGVRRPVGHVHVNLTNTGAAKLEFDQTDIYVDGQRVPRNDSERVLIESDSEGQALWEPGENLSIIAFRTVTGATPVTVANGPAQDGGIV